MQVCLSQFLFSCSLILQLGTEQKVFSPPGLRVSLPQVYSQCNSGCWPNSSRESDVLCEQFTIFHVFCTCLQKVLGTGLSEKCCLCFSKNSIEILSGPAVKTCQCCLPMMVKKKMSEQMNSIWYQYFLWGKHHCKTRSVTLKWTPWSAWDQTLKMEHYSRCLQQNEHLFDYSS